VNAPGHLTVRTRTGYFANAAPPPKPKRGGPGSDK
jgi:hypothetical protein